MFFCPCCNATMPTIGHNTEVSFPILGMTRMATVVFCHRCPAWTEVDVHSGELGDFRGMKVADLYAPFNRRVTSTRSLRAPSTFKEKQES